jgi:hypothetical protein
MRRIAIRLGIVAVVIVGGLGLRQFLSTSAGDLTTGDCFDLPPAGTETITDVQHQPCGQEHGAEVFFVGDHPASGEDPYPVGAGMLSFLEDQCLPAYLAYTGTDLTTQATFDVGWFQPTEEGWQRGDRSVICYAYRVDEARFKGSLKGG